MKEGQAPFCSGCVFQSTHSYSNRKCFHANNRFSYAEREADRPGVSLVSVSCGGMLTTKMFTEKMLAKPKESRLIAR